MAKKERSAGAIVYTVKSESGKFKFLLLKNTLKNTYWCFPKGKVEKDEDLRETVRREVKEETNLTNLEFLPEFSYDQQWYFRLKGQTIRKEATYFIVKIPTEDMNKVEISEEHEDYDWLDYREALERMNIKNNKKMLEKAYQQIKEYESQKDLGDY